MFAIGEHHARAQSEQGRICDIRQLNVGFLVHEVPTAPSGEPLRKKPFFDPGAIAIKQEFYGKNADTPPQLKEVCPVLAVFGGYLMIKTVPRAGKEGKTSLGQRDPVLDPRGEPVLEKTRAGRVQQVPIGRLQVLIGGVKSRLRMQALT